jgi:hypothetical protein
VIETEQQQQQQQHWRQISFNSNSTRTSCHLVLCDREKKIESLSKKNQIVFD